MGNQPTVQVYPAAKARRDSLCGKLGVSLPLLRSALQRKPWSFLTRGDERVFICIYFIMDFVGFCWAM